MQFWRVKCLVSLVVVWLGFAESAHSQSTFYFPRVVTASDTLTGMALSNPGSDAATVTLTYYSPDGTVAGTADRNIPAGGQVAGLANEFFSTAQSPRGWVKITSNTPDLAGFYLNGD